MFTSGPNTALRTLPRDVLFLGFSVLRALLGSPSQLSLLQPLSCSYFSCFPNELIKTSCPHLSQVLSGSFILRFSRLLLANSLKLLYNAISTSPYRAQNLRLLLAPLLHVLPSQTNDSFSPFTPNCHHLLRKALPGPHKH